MKQICEIDIYLITRIQQNIFLENQYKARIVKVQIKCWNEWMFYKLDRLSEDIYIVVFLISYKYNYLLRKC